MEFTIKFCQYDRQFNRYVYEQELRFYFILNKLQSIEVEGSKFWYILAMKGLE